MTWDNIAEMLVKINKQLVKKLIIKQIKDDATTPKTAKNKVMLMIATWKVRGTYEAGE